MHALRVTRQGDFPEWYQTIVREADLAELSPTRGCMIIKPWGYGIWERFQQEMDRRILRCLARNAAPVGIKTIAAAVEETEDTIEEVFEPHLLRGGFVQKTARGRSITPAGRAVIAEPGAARARGLFE